MADGVAALTVWQPWASLIVEGWKPYEFRKWDYRTRRPGLVGKRIAIHAGARPVKRDEIKHLLQRLARRESKVSEEALPLLERVHLQPGLLPLSAVLGTAVLGEPRRAHVLFGAGHAVAADSTRLDHHLWAWPLTDIERFNIPVPARGAQGFWSWLTTDVANCTLQCSNPGHLFSGRLTSHAIDDPDPNFDARVAKLLCPDRR